MLAKILLIKKNRLSLHRLRATIELWCNGNTADFGSVILSSNLGSSTTKKADQIILVGFFVFIVISRTLRQATKNLVAYLRNFIFA